MTIESTSPDVTESVEPAPTPASLGERLDAIAAQVSYAMSLAMLASPLLLMAMMPAVQGRPSERLSAASQVSPSRAGPQSSASPRSAAVAVWVGGDANRAATAPAVTTRAIPVIEVKVPRESKPRAETTTEPAAAKPSKPALTIQPPVARPVPVSPPAVAPVPAAAASAAPTAAPAPAAATPDTPPIAAPAPPAWTETEVSVALRACLTTLAPLSIEMEARPPIRENTCGLPAPIAIRRIGADKVEIQPAALVNCGMAAAIDDWIVKVAQPAAREAFGSPIVKLTGTSGCACRNRNGAATGPISEHAFGNALDVSGFVLADGRTIGVKSHWGATAKDAKTPLPAGSAGESAAKKPAESPSQVASTKVAGKAERAAASAADKRRSSLGGPPAAASPASSPAVVTVPEATPGERSPAERSKEAMFLRRVHAGACGVFGTVLGPEANEAHRDHLHIDLKGRKRKGICE